MFVILIPPPGAGLDKPSTRVGRGGLDGGDFEAGRRILLSLCHSRGEKQSH